MSENKQLKVLEAARCPSGAHFCDHCAVRDVSFCAALGEGEIDHLGAISIHKNFASGDIIFEEDATVQRYANIIDGTVKLCKLLPDGRQQIIGFLFPGDFIGKVYSDRYTCFVEAVTDVHMCSFPSMELESLMATYPQLNRRLFENAVTSLQRAEEWMLLLGRKTAQEKLASFILMLSRRNEDRGLDPQQVHLPMSRADIADFLGLTIETVSRQVTKLKTEQYIRLGAGNMVEIVDLERLQDIADAF